SRRAKSGHLIRKPETSSKRNGRARLRQQFDFAPPTPRKKWSTREDQAGTSVISIFLEYRLDASSPKAVEFFQQLLGRRNAPREIVVDRLQIARFVVAAGIEPASPCQSLFRKRQRRFRDLHCPMLRDRGSETELRHVVAQFLAFHGAPALDQLPSGVERGFVIQKSDPVGRHCRDPAP